MPKVHSSYERQREGEGIMKVTLDAKEVQPGELGNTEPKLIFTGPIWDDFGISFCVHGEKLRWSCDACEDHFSDRKKAS